MAHNQVSSKKQGPLWFPHIRVGIWSPSEAMKYTDTTCVHDTSFGIAPRLSPHIRTLASLPRASRGLIVPACLPACLALELVAKPRVVVRNALGPRGARRVPDEPISESEGNKESPKRQQEGGDEET